MQPSHPRIQIRFMHVVGNAVPSINHMHTNEIMVVLILSQAHMHSKRYWCMVYIFCQSTPFTHWIRKRVLATFIKLLHQKLISNSKLDTKFWFWSKRFCKPCKYSILQYLYLNANKTYFHNFHDNFFLLRSSHSCPIQFT